MARPIWKGSISFGLVTIPVQVLPATSSAEKISFRMLRKSDLSPIKYKRVAAMANVSRREAELLIENGAVRVDGQVVEVPARRVRDEQQVEIASGARPVAVEPVTLLLHKPAGIPFDASSRVSFPSWLASGITV